MEYELNPHAKEEIERRRIPLDLLQQTMNEPQQVVPTYGGRKAYQSQFAFEDGRVYLLRVIVDDRTSPAKVVTAY